MRAAFFDGSRAVQRQRVLRRQQPRLGEERNEAERLPAGRRSDQRHATGEQRGVAAELVDQEALDQRRIVGLDHRLGADQAGDHPAPVDIADQHHRHVAGTSKAHIGDVVGTEIDLRRAAGTFDQNDVGFALQPREAVQHERHQLRLDRLVLGGAGASVDLALHHELRADLALRLEQHRVHMHARADARRARLERLGAADLAALLRHRRVVRHVLRLEGHHLQPACDERAREPGDDQRFADVRARALEHERAGGHAIQNSMPCCALTPAAKWCFTSVISVTRSAASINSGLAFRPVTTTCKVGRRAFNVAITRSSGR